MKFTASIRLTDLAHLLRLSETYAVEAEASALSGQAFYVWLIQPSMRGKDTERRLQRSMSNETRSGTWSRAWMVKIMAFTPFLFFCMQHDGCSRIAPA